MRRTFPAFARAAGRVVIGGAENGAAQSAGATKKRVRRKLRDPITITDRAADRIKELMQGHPDALGVRVGVQTRGCNGLSYTLNYATELQKFEDTVTDKGVTVVIEPKVRFRKDSLRFMEREPVVLEAAEWSVCVQLAPMLHTHPTMCMCVSLCCCRLSCTSWARQWTLWRTSLLPNLCSTTPTLRSVSLCVEPCRPVSDPYLTHF